MLNCGSTSASHPLMSKSSNCTSNTHTHTDTQTHRHTDTQTQTQTQTQTHTHTDCHCELTLTEEPGGRARSQRNSRVVRKKLVSMSRTCDAGTRDLSHRPVECCVVCDSATESTVPYALPSTTRTLLRNTSVCCWLRFTLTCPPMRASLLVAAAMSLGGWNARLESTLAPYGRTCTLPGR